MSGAIFPAGTGPRRYELFIAGRWRAGATSKRLERRRPGGSDLIATYVCGDERDVALAVLAATEARKDPAWAGLSRPERSALLLRAADAIAGEAPTLAMIEAAETGKKNTDALAEISAGVEFWRFAAAAVRVLPGEVHEQAARGSVGLTVLEPVGVVGLVLPWNFPFLVSSERLPFILAAGCTAVVKPSEYAAGTALALGEILTNVGMPAGVYNVVTGSGEEAGAALVRHPDVAMISFTGSSANGRKVMAAAAEGLKRVSLELGGKNPVIIFADADLDRACDAVILGFTRNAGQACIATSRLLVETTVYDRFRAMLQARLRKHSALQPIATESQYAKVSALIRETKQAYRTVFEGPEGEGIIGATVFEDVDRSASLERDEVFGPVLSMRGFVDERHAVELANDTEYGLAAAVWTRDLERGLRLCRQVRAGRLWINSPQANFPEMPIGGFGASGIGREAGAQGILAYSERKSIVIDMA